MDFVALLYIADVCQVQSNAHFSFRFLRVTNQESIAYAPRHADDESKLAGMIGKGRRTVRTKDVAGLSQLFVTGSDHRFAGQLVAGCFLILNHIGLWL
jgi:hypothetical protein